MFLFQDKLFIEVEETFLELFGKEKKNILPLIGQKVKVFVNYQVNNGIIEIDGGQIDLSEREEFWRQALFNISRLSSYKKVLIAGGEDNIVKRYIPNAERVILDEILYFAFNREPDFIVEPTGNYKLIIIDLIPTFVSKILTFRVFPNLDAIVKVANWLKVYTEQNLKEAITLLSDNGKLLIKGVDRADLFPNTRIKLRLILEKVIENTGGFLKEEIINISKPEGIKPWQLLIVEKGKEGKELDNTFYGESIAETILKGLPLVEVIKYELARLGLYEE
jgi:hypothetical protein